MPFSTPPEATGLNRTSSAPAFFPSTHWSVVMSAGQEESTEADEALARLCAIYWYPLFAYVRRRGYGPADAQDLTQEFFAQLIEKRFLRIADPRRGRFRVFLRTAMEYFVAKEWNRAHRQKRGGGKQFVFLDDETAEDRYRNEPADNLTPDRIYERRWALSLLEQALSLLRAECEASGKANLFEAVQPMLSGDRPELSYAQMASGLGLSEGAFKVSVHRLRQRYGDLLRELVAQTVANPDEVDHEIQHLLDALAR